MQRGVMYVRSRSKPSARNRRFFLETSARNGSVTASTTLCGAAECSAAPPARRRAAAIAAAALAPAAQPHRHDRAAAAAAGRREHVADLLEPQILDRRAVDRHEHVARRDGADDGAARARDDCAADAVHAEDALEQFDLAAVLVRARRRVRGARQPKLELLGVTRLVEL